MKRVQFKKVISIILTLCMLIPYVSNIEVKGMMGDTFTEGGLKYLIFKEPQGENNGIVHVGGNNKEATEIIIPSTVTNNGNTYDVVAIDSGDVDEGFYEYNKLTSITIPDSITSIGSSAFYNCSSLTSIKIPDSVTSIGDGAFSGCSNLSSIELPNSVTSIDNNVFKQCSSLSSIELPNSITSIGNNAFYGCSSLTSITIPDSVTFIDSFAFSNCNNLKNVTILSNKLESLNINAFDSTNKSTNFYVVNENTKNLLINSCEISEDKIKIVNPSLLHKLKLNSNGNGTVTGGGTFEEGTTVTITATANDGYEFDGWNVNSGNVTLADSTLAQTTFIMPNENVEITANFVIEKAKYTLTLNTNSDVSGAVHGSGSYKVGEEVTITANPKTGYKFDNWTVNSGDVTLADDTLAQTTFTMPEGNVEITANFSEINIRDTFVDGDLKYEIITLSQDRVNGTVSVSGNNKKATSIIIPSTITNRGNTYDVVEIEDTNVFAEGSFSGYRNLTNIKIPDSITYIGKGAFNNCSRLVNIEIPKLVNYIGSSIFSGCYKLKNITILSDKLERISFNTFDLVSETAKFYVINEDIKSLLINKGEISEDKIEIIDTSLLHTLKLISNDGGTVSGNGIYMEGKKVTILAIANEDYKFNNWTVNSGNVILEDSDSAETTFIMPADDVEITANFFEEKTKYPLTLEANPNTAGEVYGSGNYEAGEIVTITAIPKAGYKFNNWVGNIILEDNTLAKATLKMPRKNLQLYANFSKLEPGDTFIDGDLRYEIITLSQDGTTGTVNVSGNNKEATEIVIPETVTNNSTTYDVVEIRGTTFNEQNGGFFDYKKLKNIVIPDSITSIGLYAFYNCGSLTSIELPKSITSMKEYVFRSCSRLENITILSDKLKTLYYSFSSINENAKFYVVDENTRNLLINQSEISENKIEIIDASKLRKLKLNSNDNGTVSGDGTFEEGKTITIKATANDGYKFDSWTVNSGKVTLEDSNSSQTTFVMPNEDVEITANFSELPKHTLVLNSNSDVAGEVYGSGSYKEKETVTIKATANDGYKFDGWTVNSGNVTLEDSTLAQTTFIMPERNVEITANFSELKIGDTFVDGNLKYEIITLSKDGANGTVNVSGNNEEATEIIIPRTVTNKGNTYDVVKIKGTTLKEQDGGFFGYKKLINIEIPDSITSIGDYAFYNCISLINVKLPNSIASINNSTFRYCSSLTSIELPDSITSIGDYAFQYCSSLTSIKLPDSITSIGDSTFSKCSSLINIELPDSITSIGDSTFSKCNSLTNIELPNSITSINDFTFAECNSLTSIKLPDSITSIGYEAFYKCSSLTNIKLPDSITSIDDEAFAYCSSLTSIELPDSITFIGNSAFYDCTKLKNITILSDKLEEFDYYTFKSISENAKFYVVNENIKNLLINECGISEDRIEIIDVSKLYTLKLNSNNNGTVSGSGSYIEGKTVTIKATAKDGYEFDGWTVNSSNVTLEDSTLAQTTFIMPNEDVEISANFSTEKTEYILTLNTNSDVWGAVYGSGSYKAGEEITITATAKEGYKFNNWTVNSSDITLADSTLTQTTFTMPERNVEITANFSELTTGDTFVDGDLKYEIITLSKDGANGTVNVSGNNKEATEIIIPRTVINNGNTYDVVKIKGTTLKKQDGGFFGYKKLINIEIPDSITSIGDYAFYTCSSLTDIKLPDSITSVGDYAFYGCNSLTSIELPASITSIGQNTFYNCNKLEDIFILSNYIEGLYFNSFSSISEDTKFYVVNDDIKNLLISKCEISANRIEIIDASKLHILKLNSNDNGTVSGSGSYMEGKTVTITAKAKNDYKFDSWSVNSGNVTLEDSNSSQTTFVMPANDVEITAIFISNNETVETPNKDLIFNVITKPEGETNGTVSVTVNNKNLTSVDIPETIKDKDGNTYTVVEIEDNAFKDCSNLQHIKLPNTIITIGQGAFENCTNLIEITIPSGVTSIGDNTFKGCIILQIVVIISGDITIGKDAFTNVADNVIYITTNNDTKDKLKPFVKDENQIQVSDGNVKDTSSVIIRTSAGGTATGNGLYKSGNTVNLKATAKDGYKFDKWIVISGDITIENINSETTSFTMSDKNVILMANFVSNSGNPDNNVGDSFVTDNKFIVTVTKPAGSDTQGTVTIVGTTDTSDTITIPSTITDKNGKVYKITFVSDGAFTGNKNITSVIIQNGITSIGNGAFKDCVNLIHISIPDSVTSIGDGAFENCTKLEKIEIPSSVILIGNNAFKGCINLSKIIILTIKVIIKNNAFENISKDASFIVINQEIKNVLIQIGIAENQIVISKELHKVTVKSDGNGEVLGSGTYSKDDTVTIKATPKYGYKFDKWTVNTGNVTLADDKLAETSFTMPNEDVEVIASFVKDEVFIESKDNLDFIIQKPATENEEGEVTFKVKDKNITSVTIPSKVKDNKGNTYVIKIIPNNAFEDCTNLKEIKIPETIISIGDSAFKGCTSLIKIVLPDTITVIGSNAFENCTSLIEITIPKNVELIKDNAFLNCTGLIKVIIFSLNLQIATNAFTGVSSTTKFIVLTVEVKAILILCHILEIQIIILDPELNLQEQIDKANELLMKNYPTLDELIQSTIDLSDGIVNYFQSK